MDPKTEEEPIMIELQETQESPQSNLHAVQNEHLHILLCHLMAPIIWPLKRRTSEAVDAHGKAALNHLISCVGVFIIVDLVLWLGVRLSLIPDSAKTLVCLGLILGSTTCSLWGLIRADTGVLIQYPFRWQWIK